MSRIILGKSAGHNVGFEIEELLPTRLLIQANSGGGKSFLIRRILEQAFGKIQCFVIDVAGEQALFLDGDAA
jgi:DNA helicase HerA-like ATPase